MEKAVRIPKVAMSLSFAAGEACGEVVVAAPRVGLPRPMPAPFAIFSGMER